MWVWPQVPLEGPPLHPPPPLNPRTPSPPTPDCASPSQSIAKRAKGGGGKRKGEGGEGKGFGLRGGPSKLQWGMGETLQTPIGARPTSGGSQQIQLEWPHSSLKLRSFRVLPIIDWIRFRRVRFQTTELSEVFLPSPSSREGAQ